MDAIKKLGYTVSLVPRTPRRTRFLKRGLERSLNPIHDPVERALEARSCRMDVPPPPNARRPGSRRCSVANPVRAAAWSGSPSSPAPAPTTRAPRPTPPRSSVCRRCPRAPGPCTHGGEILLGQGHQHRLVVVEEPRTTQRPPRHEDSLGAIAFLDQSDQLVLVARAPRCAVSSMNPGASGFRTEPPGIGGEAEHDRLRDREPARLSPPRPAEHPGRR